MKTVYRFWKVVIIDIIGVLFMIFALATGWLPGPGGIPLFIIGLSLLAINHTWAQKYIDILKDYADKLGDLIFVNNPKLQITYDLVAPILIIVSVVLLVRHNAIWMISVGVVCFFLGLTLFLGNRNRWHKLKRFFK